MSTYTKQHYEDVARLIKESWPIEDDSREAEEVILFSLTNRFADLFAADNPPICRVAWRTAGHDGPCTSTCLIEGSGFNRARFLTACGLEPEKGDN